MHIKWLDQPAITSVMNNMVDYVLEIHESLLLLTISTTTHYIIYQTFIVRAYCCLLYALPLHYTVY